MGKRGPKPKAPEIDAAQGFPSRRKGKTKAALAGVSPAARACNTSGKDSRNVPAREETPPAGADGRATPPSINVPEPPAWMTGKRAREIWREKFDDPSTRVWFKRSDHAFIARYCQRRADWERLVKRRPMPTYETHGNSGRIIRKNPEFVMMHDLHRDLRADEQLLAGNPVARVDMEKRTTNGNPAGKAAGEAPAASGDHRTTPSPLGALKVHAATRPN